MRKTAKEIIVDVEEHLTKSNKRKLPKLAY